MDASEIKDMLHNDPLTICELLLPNGRLERNDWCVGSIAGEEGRSLKVVTSGRKVGTWKDFAGEEGGNNLLELWAKTKRISFVDAYLEAKKYLGVYEEEYIRGTQKKYEPFKISTEWKIKHSEGMDYLIEKRGISKDTIKAFKVTTKGVEVMFPYYSADGSTCEMAKFLKKEGNKKKQMWSSSNTAKTLFGKSLTSDNAHTLIITEGEIDCMTLWQELKSEEHGIVSVPFGAKWEAQNGNDPNSEWISNDFDYLSRFETIILALDNDEAGQSATKSIVKRLGRERCRSVDLGEYKDANEVMLKKGDLKKIIEDAKNYEPENLKNAFTYEAELAERFFNPEKNYRGIPLPWNIPFFIRMNELSIMTGFSGSGKTMLLNYLCCHLASTGNKVCIASLEIRVEETISCLVAQTLGKDAPSSREELTGAMNWLGDGFWFYDHVGQADFEPMIESFAYAHKRHGINIIVIDSLMKCGLAFDDYKGQKLLVDKLADFVHKYDVHIFLVAHSKKKESEKEYVGKMDVKGITEITDMAHNVLSVWRHKAKEEAINGLNPDTQKEEIMDLEISMFNSLFSVHKQRGDKGEEPEARLWYDKDSRHYTTQWDGGKKGFYEG